MSKRKALGQDPLAWIKLTQAQGAQRAAAEASPAEEAPARGGGMNWPFLVIYILNMFLLLALVFLVHRDLGRRLTVMEGEVRALRARLRVVQEAAEPRPLPQRPTGSGN